MKQKNRVARNGSQTKLEDPELIEHFSLLMQESKPMQNYL